MNVPFMDTMVLHKNEPHLNPGILSYYYRNGHDSNSSYLSNLLLVVYIVQISHKIIFSLQIEYILAIILTLDETKTNSNFACQICYRHKLELNLPTLISNINNEPNFKSQQ